jgi:hypothetical protein
MRQFKAKNKRKLFCDLKDDVDFIWVFGGIGFQMMNTSTSRSFYHFPSIVFIKISRSSLRKDMIELEDTQVSNRKNDEISSIP